MCIQNCIFSVGDRPYPYPLGVISNGIEVLRFEASGLFTSSQIFSEIQDRETWFDQKVNLLTIAIAM